MSLLGVAAGFLVYLFGSAAGLTALFAVVPFLYDVVRLLGAGYLLWLSSTLGVAMSPARACSWGWSRSRSR
jgi:threonine/homoserine/homoserine lactone efflux protein